MHPIHTTPGLIIDSRPRGEAGKLISIFTRDFGLVMASAQGIRFEKSKLRYHTQDYSFGTFSLVRGREFWRLTSAMKYDAEEDTKSSKVRGLSERLLISSEIKGASSAGLERTLVSPAARELIIRLASLLKRLLHGEEAHPELFDCIQSCQTFIEGHSELNDDQLQTLESLIVIRILNKLGYIGDVTDLNGHIQSAELTIELLDDLKGKRTVMNQHINKALKESQL